MNMVGWILVLVLSIVLVSFLPLTRIAHELKDTSYVVERDMRERSDRARMDRAGE